MSQFFKVNLKFFIVGIFTTLLFFLFSINIDRVFAPSNKPISTITTPNVTTSPNNTSTSKQVSVYVNGRQLPSGFIKDGHIYSEISNLADALGKDYSWDEEKSRVDVDDKFISGIFFEGYSVEEINDKMNIFLGSDIISQVGDIIDDAAALHIKVEQPVKLNLSKDKSVQNDYLINVEISGNSSGPCFRQLMLVYIQDSGNYNLKFCKVCGKFGFDERNIDIDSDGRSELVFEINEKYRQYVEIYKYSGTRFVQIFKKDLSYSLYSSPFQYENSYEFVQNQGNPKLMDILFKVNTSFDEDKFKNDKDDLYRKKFNQDRPRAVHEQVRYIFNGSVYLPNKSVYDFEKYSH